MTSTWILQTNPSIPIIPIIMVVMGRPTSLPSGSGFGAEHFVAALVESSDDAIVGLTPQGTVVSWNGAAERLFGYRSEEMLGRNTAVLFPPNRRDELSTLLARVQNGETVRNLPTERLRKNGTPIAVSVTVSPVVGPGDALLGMSVVGRDMSLPLRTEEILHSSWQSTVEALTLLQMLQDSAPIGFGFGFVDPEFRIVLLNEMLAALGGSTVPAQAGRPAAEVIPTIWPYVEPLFRRVMETGQAIVNTELSTAAPSEPGALRHSLVSSYPVRIDGEIVGAGVIVIDITERKQIEEAHKTLAHAAIGALGATVKARDPYSDGHQNRVATIASAIAAELDLEEDVIEGIELAARIHDIGKIAIPIEILTHPGRLNAPAWDLMKLHASTGADIVRGVQFPWPVADMVEQHHERPNGSGYPSGLRGEEILLGALIIAAADTVDAMTSHRPYRPAQDVTAALDELDKGRGRLFEPTVVDACLRLFREQRLDPKWKSGIGTV